MNMAIPYCQNWLHQLVRLLYGIHIYGFFYSLDQFNVNVASIISLIKSILEYNRAYSFKVIRQ